MGSTVQENVQLWYFVYVVVSFFQPLELVSLHQNLKLDGINCGLGKLVDFLDEQVIVGTADIVTYVLICYHCFLALQTFQLSSCLVGNFVVL